MNPNEWSDIPTKLKAKGFSVFYDRVSYEPEHPLWCARADRDGRQWSTVGENLSDALLELERQTEKATEDSGAATHQPETKIALWLSALPPVPKS